jgi:hypothetical protein
MAEDESTLARRTRTATRIGVGATVIGMEKAAQLLDAVAGRQELPALPAGDQTTTPAPDDAAPGTSLAIPGPTPMSDRRALTLGVVFAAEEGAVSAIEGLSRARRRLGALADRSWRIAAPEPIRNGVDERVNALRRRGRDEDEPSRDEAAEAFGEVVGSVAGGPWLVDMVNDIVGEVLDPILDTALPLVLTRLTDDPAPIQDLVRDQSLGMAGEITDGVRSGAVSADSGLERVARKLTLRRKRAGLGGPPAQDEPPGDHGS